MNSLKILCILSCFYSHAHFITYQFSGGRFGDNLLAYSRAKYFSYKHNIPLAYQRFKYSDQLALHNLETDINSVNRKSAKKFIIKKNTDWNEALKTSKQLINFEIPYFSEIPFERFYIWNQGWIHLDINWNDPQFKDILRTFIRPVNDIKLITPPKDHFNIAIHIRRGGNFDGEMRSVDKEFSHQKQYCDTNAPLKFPPLSFYIDSLNFLLKIIEEEKIYIFIFTDDLKPEELCYNIQDALCFYKKEISINARVDEVNNENENILEDFFSMLNFDALIRAESSYSIMIGHLGDFKYEIYPAYQHWEENYSAIDKFKIEVRN